MSAVLSTPSRNDALWGPLPPVRRPSFLHLTRVELRKTVDTRAGRLLLAAIVLLSVAIVTAALFLMTKDELAFSGWSRDALIPVVLLLPVLGVLAMASEWTQRTALTTFTLTPRRLRVLSAKLVAAAALGVVVTLFVQVLAMLGLAVRAGVLDAAADWSDLGRTVGGSLVATSLALLMGAAFGALVLQSAGALVAYFAAPNVVLFGVAIAFDEGARWVDVQAAFGRLQRFDGADLGPTLVALTLWIVLPLVLGLWRSVRRNVS